MNRSALMVALILRYLGMDARTAVERCPQRCPGALFNQTFAEYLLTGLVEPLFEHLGYWPSCNTETVACLII